MKTKWDELGLRPEDIERVDGALKQFAVPPPGEAPRRAAVDAALGAMGRAGADRLRSMWAQVRTEARFLPWWYYLASAAVAAAGLCLLLTNPYDAQRLGILAGAAPLPVLLGLLELFHGPDEGMAEIECACRYSPARVLSARMLVVGALSCAAAAALGCFAGFDSPWLASGLVVVPYCLSAACGLALSTALQGRASSAQVALAVACLNGAAAAGVAAQPKWVLAVAPACWAALMALSLLLLLAALRGTLIKAEKPNERTLLQWN